MKNFDWRNILTSWQAETNSIFGSRKQWVLDIDTILQSYQKAGNSMVQQCCLQDLCFRLNRWLGSDGSGSSAGKQLLKEAQVRRDDLKNLNDAQDLAHWPKRAIPDGGALPLNLPMNKQPGDKYFTLGMLLLGGMGKDLGNEGLLANRKRNESKPEAWKGLVYMNEGERLRFLVIIKDGLLFHEVTNDIPLDTATSSITRAKVSNGMYIFVMDGMGRIFSASKTDVEHHSSFLAGNPAAAAGTIQVTKGKLMMVTDQSGHYSPSKDFVDQFLAEVSSKGADISSVKLSKMSTRAQLQSNSKSRGITTGSRLYPSGPRNEGC